MRGLAYIINSPIPGKTCFKLTSRHKKGWKKENDIHLFPMTIPQRWHSVCWLSSSLFLVFVYFIYSKFLLPTGIGSQSSNFACILFWDSALHSLLPVFDVLSEQIVTSELLLRQCLSVFALPEMTFCLARRPAAWHCSGFLLPGSAIFFLSAERRVSKESLMNLPHNASPLSVSSVPWCWWWSQWVIGTTCYEMRVATL